MSLLKIATSLRSSSLLASSLKKVAQTASLADVSSCRSNNLFSKECEILSQTAVYQKSMQRRSNASSSKAVSVDEDESSAHYCRPCVIQDREDMVDFMSKLFVTREPLMKSLGATPTNARKFVAFCIDKALNQNSSFLAIDEKTGKMCGLRVNEIGPSDGEELKHDFGPEMNAIPKFLHYMENDMPELLKTDRYMRHVAICVEPSASQCGIATDLMKLSVASAKKQQLFGMIAMCSWKLPYVLASKMGFKKVREIPYDMYAKDQLLLSKTQAEAFTNLAKEQGAARMMVKEL